MNRKLRSGFSVDHLRQLDGRRVSERNEFTDIMSRTPYLNEMIGRISGRSGGQVMATTFTLLPPGSWQWKEQRQETGEQK